MNNIKFTSDALNISKKPVSNINGSPVLCTLEGVVADFKNPTRNGRFYSKKLWEKALKSDLVQEQIANGGIMMELNHPADRDDTDLSCVAAIMPELPKETNDGKLVAKVHIIDTPMGQIANTLARYGYKLGISSRGNGDVDYDGSVNEDTYELQCWDLVAMPSVKEARLSLVTESLNSQTLTESLNKIIEQQSNDTDKQAIVEKLAQLNITLTSENAGEAREVSIPVDMTVSDNGDVKIETVDNKEKEVADDTALPEVTVTADVVMDAQAQVEQEVEAEVADDTVDNSTEDDNIQVEIKDETVDNAEGSVFDDLQESLKENSSLKQTNESLQNSLSVSIAKEQQLNEELSRCKKKIAELVESQKHIVGLTARANKFEADNTQLTESLDNANSKSAKLSRTIRLQTVNINQLENAVKRTDAIHKRQLESLSKELDNVKQETHKLEEEYKQQIQEKESKITSLTENIDSQSSDFKSQSEQLVKEKDELSKKLAQMTEAYLKLKCQISGVDYNRIKDNKYSSVDDINRLTESYVSRRMTENALPFANQEIRRVKYTRPNESYSNPYNPDDVAYFDTSMSEGY